MGRWALGLILAATLLAGCRQGPRFEHYPPPALAVDREPFAAAGCPTDDAGWPRCLPDSPLAALGCDVMRPVSDLLGGLNPAYPMAACEIYPHWHEEDASRSAEALEASGAYILRQGGLWPVYVRYVVYREGSFAAIQDAAALRALYAPIESPEEALSYALAATDMEALYGLAREPGYVYAGPLVQDTHVTPMGDGYQVLLYYTRVFGCGPHWTYAVQIRVNRDGEISELSRTTAFRDKSTDGMCID